jgi:hypothetical protein
MSIPRTLAALCAAWLSATAVAETVPGPMASDFLLREGSARPGVPSKFGFTFGPALPWSGPIRWSYNPAGASSALGANPATTVTALQGAMAKWSAVCGVSFRYDGLTSSGVNGLGGPDGVNVVAWDSVERYLPGAAGVTIAFYQPDRDGSGALIDADIVFDNTGRITGPASFDAVAVHEVGHMLGLDHSERSDAVMSGPPGSAYNGRTALANDDIRGCRCLYGPATGNAAGYSCSLPTTLELGRVAVGAPSVPQAFTVFNDGTSGLAIATVAFAGGALQRTGGSCAPGSVVPPGGKCDVVLTATPTSVGAEVGTVSMATSDGEYVVPVRVTGIAGGPSTIDAVEYYNAGLDHYFISWVGNEIAILDAGVKSHGWARTGEVIRTYPASQPGASPVCRYYIPPEFGNSHFYGRDTRDCDRTGQDHPSFVLEDPAFMSMVLPTEGVCPAGTRNVYRVFSARKDANHRYTTSVAIRDQMVAAGWEAEGDGDDRVAMCAPA